MDDRKKMIRDLGERKQDTLKQIDELLENLGDALLARTPGEEAAEYQRFLREIEETGELLRTLDAERLRLQDLEGEIQRKEQGIGEFNTALSDQYALLGARVLEDPDFADLGEAYHKQADTLSSKIRSLEDRLRTLDEKGEANVFTWIGKNTQEMVIRSFLGKSRQNLRRLQAAAGEKYLHGEKEASDAVLAQTQGEIAKLRARQADYKGDIEALREECRKINEFFNPEGSPGKKKQALERYGRQTREQLGQVCLRRGREAEDAGFEGEWTPGEAPGSDIPGQIREKRALIRDYDGQIEKLNASLEIDAQKQEIEKMEKAIGDHQRRIGASEAAIRELNGKIEESNRQIQELMKI
jgi:predicted  nucleic acid-binding Zn-ribbon protein